MPSTVRDASFALLRRLGLRTLFANPGSTEIDLLADLPEDFEFVLGLHEATVVGMASGWALARGEPALVNLHTTAGLGNAVAALATARVNRAPMVVLVGQQDRRHIALEPFLTGRLRGLAGDYPVWIGEPARAQDVPGAIARAWHEATTGRGPALVICAMDDWAAPADAPELAAPERVLRGADADPALVAEVAARVDAAVTPAIVVGAGTDDDRGWAAVTALAEHLRCPVWQESFGARAGFPQDHACFAGHLPAGRAALRAMLAAHDLVLVVGAPALRQYGFEEGPLVGPDTRLVVITGEPDEAHRAAADLALLAGPAGVCEQLTGLVAARPQAPAPATRVIPPAPDPPAEGAALRAGHVLHALAERLPEDVILIEEAPSARPELHRRIAARRPMGFVSAAMGGLGFAIPAAIGMRLGSRARPVVAVVGDGSSIYTIQSLWSAAHYGAGALIVILANGRYAVMDRLAERHGGTGPWPAFDEIDVAAVARGFGCEARTLTTLPELEAALDEVLPGLADRSVPLVLSVGVQADATFSP